MSKDYNLSEENETSEENLPSENDNSPEQSDSTTSSENVEQENVVDESKDDDVFGDDDNESLEEVKSEEEENESESENKDVFSGDDEDELTPSEEENVPVENATSAVTETPTKVRKKPEPVDSKRWYSLRVISGKERKIKERIELEISRSKWEDFVTNVLVPSEKVYKIRNGKKVILERNILPGYILIEADQNNFTGEMVQAITNVPNVIHFLGKNNPIPMQASEANRMLGKVDESQSLSEAMVEPFIVGETVKIIDGPFNEFVGDIQEVNEEKKKMKVIVKIFGRGTEVELNFMQVEKQQ